MRKRIRAWAELIDLAQLENVRRIMVSLSYAKIEDWQANDIRNFIKTYKRILGKGLLGYAWVAELQARGAVHYHIVIVAKKGTNIPMPDKAGLWLKGSTNIRSRKTHFYLLKYAQKTEQKESNYRKGQRIFAVYISPGVREQLDDIDYYLFRLTSCPKWLMWETIKVIGLAEGHYKELKLPQRRKGGGYEIIIPNDKRDIVWEVDTPWELVKDY